MTTKLMVAALLAVACAKDDGISAELGARCTAMDECEDACLSGPGWPGGLCTRPCTASATCPRGAVCIDTGDGSFCLFMCNDDPDCDFLNDSSTAAWVCKPLTEAGTGADAGMVRACAGE